jgi:cobalt-zinc-cadmium efflux system protein
MHDHRIDSRGLSRRRLGLVLGLTITLLLVEGLAGFLTRSLALLADAAHMLADVAALALGLIAMRFAERPATPQRTFGFYRVEILAALANAVVLIVLSGLILFEAIERLRAPADVKTIPMLLVAIVGLGVNLASMRLLKKGAEGSLNLRAAYLEVFSDALTSLGVILAALTILVTGWSRADALVSGVIALFILPRTWLLLRDAVAILLEGTPAHLSLPSIRDTLLKVPGVVGVHDLHVWSLTSGVHSMSAHVVRAEGSTHDDVLARVRETVFADFTISHVTLQVESSGCDETHP